MLKFTAADDAEITYSDEGAGRPLVLLHGLMAHRGFFDRQHPLASRFRLICVDLRGHGDSASGREPPSIERLAQDVTELCERLNLEDAIGIGWSMGASVLWHVLAGSASGRFAAAVIVDMTPCVLNDGQWDLGLSREVCEDRRAAIDENFQSFAEAAGQAIFAQPLSSAAGEASVWAGREFARNDPEVIGALWNSLVGQDFRQALATVAQPTLIVHGAHSHLYGSDTADYLASTLPDARTVQFDRSGHSPHIEQPELFNQAIADFAATLPPVRPTRINA